MGQGGDCGRKDGGRSETEGCGPTVFSLDGGKLTLRLTVPSEPSDYLSSVFQPLRLNELPVS